jgi:hypothetical protein
METRKRWNAKLIWEVMGDIKEDGIQEVYRVTEEHINADPGTIVVKGLLLSDGQTRFTAGISEKYLAPFADKLKKMGL